MEIVFVLLIGVFVVGLLTIRLLQAGGDESAYKVGFPVEQFSCESDHELSLAQAPQHLRVRRSSDHVLVTEQPYGIPGSSRTFWTSGWPDKLTGVIEQKGDRLVFSVRANLSTSLTWAFLALFSFALAWIVAFRTPELHFVDKAVLLGLVASAFSVLASFVWRAKKRAALLATDLGFPLD
ncbi:MAG: hypothetical protein AAGG50_15210 [Bacteroidota bacterium]